MGQILFISRRGDCNIGDHLSSPLLYFKQNFPAARRVEVHLGDRPNVRLFRKFLGRKLRDNARLIIVGGGGLIGQEYFEDDINFWSAGTGAPKVLWGAGHNSHDVFSVDQTDPSPAEYTGLSGFGMVGIRDWGAGFGWVPCASCMHEQLSEPASERGGLVAALHHDVRSSGAYIPALLSATKEEVDVVFNDSSVDVFFGKLRAAKAVVTNSYHAAYWSTLMGKRVVVVGGGSKVRLLKHRPMIATKIDWAAKLEEAPMYPGAIEECRDRNVTYCSRIVESYGGPERRFHPTASYRRDPVGERERDLAPIYEAPLPIKNKVPKIVHLVFGLSPDFGGKPFNAMHHNAVLSVSQRARPEEIFLHYRFEPDNEWYRRIRHLITPCALTEPEGEDAEQGLHFAHKSDRIRLQLLRDFGGIYLDLDTVTVKNFDRFLEDDFTIGMQGVQDFRGLCNAVMVSAKQSKFVTTWLDQYKSFNAKQWDRFSVRLPYAMWRSGKVSINVQPYDVFHWPLYDKAALKSMFEQNCEFPNAVCHHLWESVSYKKYFPEGDVNTTIERIKHGSSTYSRLMRDLL